MQAFLVSLSTVAIAEMGDRTQFLALMLAARFRKPWTIMAGILIATIADHLAAGAIGIWFGHRIPAGFLDALVGGSLMAMALWTLLWPDAPSNDSGTNTRGAFATTVIAFFLAEIGDKTQLATLALSAAYANLLAVVAGSTIGMLIANAPVVFLGERFAGRLPLGAIKVFATVVFFVLGTWFVFKAARMCWPPISWACF